MLTARHCAGECRTPGVLTRNGSHAGETQFRNMHAVYDELPGQQERLEGDGYARFLEILAMMRHRPGSGERLTEAQKQEAAVRKAAGAVHPLTDERCCMPIQDTRWDRRNGTAQRRQDLIICFDIMNGLISLRASVAKHVPDVGTHIRPADLSLIGSLGGNDGHQTKRLDSALVIDRTRPRKSAAG
jgi:hypothetical protein